MVAAGQIEPSLRDPGGQRVGPYRLVKKLGQGGMGVVHLAQRGDEAPVALKLLREPHGDSGAARRFHREARALMAIDSPHVVRVLDVGEDAGLPFFTMEFLEGRPLDAWLRQLGPLDPAAACRLFADACAGLAAAHAHGIVHRDLKPANLFLWQTGEHVALKLCDFGVAKQLDTTLAQLSVTDLTSSGGLIGSPMYMSPEQARDGSQVDRRSDLWSLCLSLHEAISGVRPWQGCRTVGELILAIHSTELPSLRSLAPWTPAPLAAVVARGLRRDPAERWPDAAALRDALLPFAAPSPLSIDDLRAADTSRLPSDGATSAGLVTGTPLPRSRAPLVLGGATLGAALLALLLRPAAPAAPAAGPGPRAELSSAPVPRAELSQQPAPSPAPTAPAASASADATATAPTASAAPTVALPTSVTPGRPLRPAAAALPSAAPAAPTPLVSSSPRLRGFDD